MESINDSAYPPPSEFTDTFKKAVDSNNQTTVIYLVIVLVVVLVVVLTICGLAFYCVKKNKAAIRIEMQSAAPQPTATAVQAWEFGADSTERFLQDMEREKPVRFTAQQICSFTSNYKTTLGSGGFGDVYKGQFPNGVKIGVKVLKKSVGGNAEEQFMAEVGTIGRTYHINLVRLYGFCYDNLMSALVYEYMENGSLDNYLSSTYHKQALEWEKLHEIAIGTGKGIAYLHEECKQRIVHYDIKPGNVLLDANFFPKVADFGLAKLFSREDTHISMTRYRGTPGYAAPEFMLRNFPITYKCDVYSYGMLLLDIVGKRRPNVKVGSNDSLDWFPKQVWEKYEKGEFAAMMGECGIEEEHREKAERMCMVALWCAQDSPGARPPMSAVVKMLEGGVEIVPPPRPFHYLYALGMDGLKPQMSSDYSSDFSTCEESISHWYKPYNETTTTMAKYEIQIATSAE